MKSIVIDNIVVLHDDRLSLDEIMDYLTDEQQLWKTNGKELARVEMTVEGDFVIVKGVERSPVRRVRRITGYLSNMENFNDGKKAELAERYKHM